MTGFRNASLDDLETVLEWAAQEGWNPGLDDAAAFFAADPGGFFVATADGVPVASISVVNHAHDFAFLGLYIVTPAYRGQGIGYGLWQHALRHAGDRTVGLDGVPAQQANYAASGFRPAGGTVRFSGQIAPKQHPNIRKAETSDIQSLIELEAVASGVEKVNYLGAWFRNTVNRVTLVSAQGFCTVRRCRSGAKIGPLVADTQATAQQLVSQASALMGPQITIDVPASSDALAHLCRTLGMQPGFDTARMYLGPAPSGTGPCFAVTSLELG